MAPSCNQIYGGICGGEGWVWDQNGLWILTIQIIINGLD